MTIAAPTPATEPHKTDAPRPEVSFVLPAYNEEARLPAGLDRVIAFLAEQDFDSEIVIVDDGSRDRTPEIVREPHVAPRRSAPARDPPPRTARDQQGQRRRDPHRHARRCRDATSSSWTPTSPPRPRSH